MKLSPLTTAPSKRLLQADDCVLLLVNHQPQMAFATKSIEPENLINNVTALAKVAQLFSMPVILTTVAAAVFAGPMFPSLQAALPDEIPIDKSTLNAWEDERIVARVEETKRTKLIIAGLWTEVCVLMPALSALEQGLDVYMVTDASGGITAEAHDTAVLRMIQAGVQPMTWLQVMLELQRDWARAATYPNVIKIAKEHAGNYGLGLFYAASMLTEKPKE